MTALEKYIRLEAMGEWRETEGAPARDVVVSFGNATLVLTDMAERPLGHWALAGVALISEADGRAIYAMSPEGSETLAIRDPEMIAAIAAVTRAHLMRDPVEPPPTSRRWLVALGLAVAFSGLIALFPVLVREQAIRMVPAEALPEFGDRMLLQVMAARGPLCADPAGRRALGILAERVAFGARPQIRALDLGPAPVALLPGPTVVLGRAALDRAEDPAEVAGWIALALAREAMLPGTARLMQAVGPLSNLRYILTGRLSESDLAKALRAALDPPIPEEVDAAFERLRAANLPTAPLADGLRRAGLPAPLASAEGDAALSDQDWVALQGLCS